LQKKSLKGEFDMTELWAIAAILLAAAALPLLVMIVASVAIAVNYLVVKVASRVLSTFSNMSGPDGRGNHKRKLAKATR
jgi:hypothetical protein